MSQLHLTHTLIDAFSALADEVQSLFDRNTILEHKLRFAHEQVRCLTLCFASLGGSESLWSRMLPAFPMEKNI